MIGYGIVKSTPRLIILIFAFFIGIFAICLGLSFLFDYIFNACNVPPSAINVRQLIKNIFWMVQVITLYSTAIVGINYAFRRKIPVFISIPLLFIIITGLSIAVTFLYERSLPLLGSHVPITSNLAIQPGTILFEGNTKQVLIQNKASSIRLTSLLPQQNSLITDLIQDSTDLGKHLAQFWEAGLISFVIAVAFLLYFLTSLGPLINLSEWPLANLLFGLLLLRFSLWIQNFLFSEPVMNIIGAFITPLVPSIMLPFIALLPLFIVGTFIHLFAFLLYLSKDRKKSNGS